MKNRTRSQNGMSGLICTLKGKFYVNRNSIDRSAHSDGAWCHPGVAAQPELGLWPERRFGLDIAYSDRPAFAGQDLSSMTRSNADLFNRGGYHGILG
jgi:hypothetical protein